MSLSIDVWANFSNSTRGHNLRKMAKKKIYTPDHLRFHWHRPLLLPLHFHWTSLSWSQQAGKKDRHEWKWDLFVWLVGFLTSSSTTRLYRGRIQRLTSDNFMCCHTRDRAGRPWPLSQPVTDTTSRERAATAGIKPGTSLPGVEHSTSWATAQKDWKWETINHLLKILNIGTCHSLASNRSSQKI